MQNRYRLYRRGNIFCTEDTRNRSQKSLRVTDRKVAERLVLAMNEAAQNPHLHLQLARAYLSAADPRMITRTWQDVANELATHGREATQARYARAFQGRDFARLLSKRPVIPPTPSPRLGSYSCRQREV